MNFLRALALLTATVISMSAQNYIVYVGTYTSTNGSKGIYKFGFDAAVGGVSSPIELAGETDSPSFLAIHPNHRFLYAVNEGGNYQGKKQGAVSAFSINPQTHKLAALNTQPSMGADPCHISIDREGTHVLIANYTGGSVAVLPIDGDGGLKSPTSFIQHTGSGTVKSRQSEPHAHSINLDKSGKIAFVCDLGLDKVILYNYNASIGKLTENTFATLKPGSGPRHFSFNPDFTRAYTINELGSTVTGFNYDGKTLTEFQTISTLPENTPGNSTAEVVIHPNGKFLYGSNRGHNSIAVFSIDQKSGQLTRIQNASTEGKTPRNFAIEPSGKFLIAANQDSNNITIFRIAPDSGKLTYTGTSVQASKPVCIRFLAE